MKNIKKPMPEISASFRFYYYYYGAQTPAAGGMV
jgi:hypothetical protein